MRDRVLALPAAHRDRLLDGLLAAAAAVLTVAAHRPAGVAWAVALAAVGAAGMLARRRWPVPALAAVTLALLPTVALGGTSSGLVVTVGALMYSTALHTTHRRPWVYGSCVFSAVFVTGLVADFAEWWNLSTLGLFTWVFGCGAVGDAVRNRRAYIAEVTERARQAEQTREEEARRRVMDERLRIARELHDVVAHHIAVINVQAGAAGHVLRDRPEAVWPVLEHIREASDTVLREIRSVIGVLRDPGELDDTGPSPGVARIPELVGSLSAAGFDVRVEADGEERSLPAIVDLAAYRIVQEALTNAHRYGDGSARLAIRHTPDAILIDVVNRVDPRRTGRAGSGFGLLGMQERASAAHGTVTAGPADGGRFHVHAVLPVAAS
ncbi:histidine kinase [Dactylosporangium sp. NPDC005572]|uniref:sensor histidine kinase n=1 Tax=Dactylosporangium sp. NPDC005572 TaxID=3156889 RepID=UPI00339EB19F